MSSSVDAESVIWRTQADGKAYEVLAHAVDRIKGVPGSLVEIGTRRGGSSMLMMDRLVANGDKGRVMLCIDPYGDLPYKAEEGNVVRLDYDNSMRGDTLRNLYAYVHGKPVNLFVLVMEDTEFFTRFADGYPVYDGARRLANEYALVYFDGPHHLGPVADEVAFFHARTRPGAVFVFDDIDHYDHDALECRLLASGYHLLEKGMDGAGVPVKASYVKTSESPFVGEEVGSAS